MFNPVVTIVRVLSMFLILLTHFLSWKNVNSFQIATVGVSAFLFISGYLYGARDIDNKVKWIGQRIKRVLVPFWIFLFFLSVIIWRTEVFFSSIKSFGETLLNLQGIRFLIYIPFKLGNYHNAGLSHCWFLTVIMLCYFFVAVMKNTKFEYFVNRHLTLSIIVLMLLHFSLSFFHISIGTIVIFFVGYFFKKYESEKSSFKSVLFFLIVVTSFILFILRIVLKHYIDATSIYDLFIAPLITNACSVSFFIIVRQICALKEKSLMVWYRRRFGKKLMFIRTPFS